MSTLDEMAARLESIATAGTMDTVKREVAVGGVRLIAQEFARSTDPYGNAWHQLKRPDSNRLGGPLVKTGTMRDSVFASPTPTGVRFTVNTPYAAYHQYGTETIPVRMMLPKPWLGLPQSWRDLIAKSYTRTLRERVSR